MSKGQWTAAHQLWHDGSRAIPVHHLLSPQRAKDEAFAFDCSAAVSPAEVHIKEIGELSESEEVGSGLGAGTQGVFITPQPLLSPEECEDAVRFAEDHACGCSAGADGKPVEAKEGWTTSRHYAVPTTDIPVHEIPRLLAWYNRIMQSVLLPFICKAFPRYFERSSSAAGEPVLRTHDAFVVKYHIPEGDGASARANAQRFLPMHTDESQISLTIALNGSNGERDGDVAFEGGGTYFAALDQAVSPASTPAAVAAAITAAATRTHARTRARAHRAGQRHSTRRIP